MWLKKIFKINPTYCILEFTELHVKVCVVVDEALKLAIIEEILFSSLT